MKKYNLIFLLKPKFGLFFKPKYFGSSPFFASDLFNFRVTTFLNCFHKNGKKLKSKIFLQHILLVLKFIFKCKNPIIFLNFVLRVLEPFFELKNIRRKRRSFLIPTIITLKKRSFLASRFFLEGVVELRRKQKNTSLLFVVIEEISNIVYNRRKSTSLKKYLRYNFLLRKYRFLTNRKFKYASKFPSTKEV